MLRLEDVFFQQTIDIPFGTNCAPLLDDIPLFLWGWFHTGTSWEERKKLAVSFNFTFRYKEAIKPRNPNGLVEIIPSLILRTPSRVGWSLSYGIFVLVLKVNMFLCRNYNPVAFSPMWSTQLDLLPGL